MKEQTTHAKDQWDRRRGDKDSIKVLYREVPEKKNQHRGIANKLIINKYTDAIKKVLISFYSHIAFFPIPSPLSSKGKFISFVYLFSFPVLLFGSLFLFSLLIWAYIVSRGEWLSMAPNIKVNNDSAAV